MQTTRRADGRGKIGPGGVAETELQTHLELALMNKPGVAAVLSLVVPGFGQIYNGAFLRGIFWLIITPGFWVGSGGTLGWVCHLISAYTAYNYARHYG